MTATVTATSTHSPAVVDASGSFERTRFVAPRATTVASQKPSSAATGWIQGASLLTAEQIRDIPIWMTVVGGGPSLRSCIAGGGRRPRRPTL